MQLAITNISNAGLNLPYLEKYINPGATIIFEVAQSELCKMVDLQQAVTDGKASYQVTPNAIEAASGLVSAGIPLVPGPAGPPGTSGGNITTFWFHDDASDVAAYKSLFTVPADDPIEDDMFVTVTSAGGPQLLEHAHITDPGSPGTTTIPAGPWTFNLYCAVSNAGGNSSIVLHVLKRNLAGAETELFNVPSGQINELTTAPGLHVINSTQPQINLLITDRLVVRPMAQTTSATARTVHMYHDGVLHNSYMLVPNTGIPDATSTARGIQSAQGKRIELQSYESCKYQLNASAIAGFNPAATSAADWDGAVAGAAWTADAAAHVRVLNQSTGVIYTLTTETTCTATGETALFGALLSVPGSTGSPMYRQTAATGAGTAVFALVTPADATTTTHGLITAAMATKLAGIQDGATNLPGYSLLMAMNPGRLLLPPTAPGRTHLFDATAPAIKQWSDVSGYGLHQVQPTASRDPSLVVSGADVALGFTAANTNWLEGPNPAYGAAFSKWTKVVVCGMSATGTALVFTNSTVVFAMYVGVEGNGQVLLTSDATGTNGHNLTIPSVTTALHVYVYVYDGTQSNANRVKCYVDLSETPSGAVIGTMAASLTVPQPETLGIATGNHTSLPLNTPIALLADFPNVAFQPGSTLTQLHTALAAALVSV